MINPNNKIVVVGVSASGKTTFSRKLSEKLKLPLTLMDSIMWKPGWNYIGDEEVIQILDTISKEPKWIIEGYINTLSRSFIFDRADLIIYLDYSPLVSAWRYIKRWYKHRKKPRPEMQGSPEKFSFKFLKLVLTKGESVSLNKYLKDVKPQSKIMVFHSHKEAERFIDKIE